MIGIPVADVDLAKTFSSEVAGVPYRPRHQPWSGDAGGSADPTGSPCSIVIGDGIPLGEPGTTKGAQLVVQDIDTARAELVARGLEISDVMQLGPEGTPGSRFAFFADPDGNGWSVQELKR